MMFAVPDSYSWPMANFAQRLRDLRSARKLTQTRLAELLQVSPRVYSRWETDDVTPHFDTIVRIAELLEVSLDDLAGRKESQAPPKIRQPRVAPALSESRSAVRRGSEGAAGCARFAGQALQYQPRNG